MAQVAAYPPATEELLTTLIERILEVGAPQKMVLFGSRARRDARPDSNLDLLIVEESTLRRFRRAPRYLRAPTGTFPAKDVIVWTSAEIAKWSNVPTAPITTALREGRVLYAR